MNNDRLRITMIRFVVIFVIVGIVGIYLRNTYVQKNGPRQGFFGAPENYKTETYDDGKVKERGALVNGFQKDGDWIYFREDGTIEAVETYKDGKLVKVVEDGKVVDSVAPHIDTVKK